MNKALVTDPTKPTKLGNVGFVGLICGLFSEFRGCDELA
jgi:hypothetical protein